MATDPDFPVFLPQLKSIPELVGLSCYATPAAPSTLYSHPRLESVYPRFPTLRNFGVHVVLPSLFSSLRRNTRTQSA